MAKSDGERFTLHNGDLRLIERGTGPTLEELAKRGQSFITDENGRVLICAESSQLERVLDPDEG